MMEQYTAKHVCAAWQRRWLDERAGGRAANDTLIVARCSEMQLPLVTRDVGVQRKARNAGVNCFAPAEYAARRIDLQTASQRFWVRYIARAPGWLVQQRVSEQPRAAAGIVMSHDILSFVWEGQIPYWRLKPRDSLALEMRDLLERNGSSVK